MCVSLEDPIPTDLVLGDLTQQCWTASDSERWHLSVSLGILPAGSDEWSGTCQWEWRKLGSCWWWSRHNNRRRHWHTTADKVVKNKLTPRSLRGTEMSICFGGPNKLWQSPRSFFSLFVCFLYRVVLANYFQGLFCECGYQRETWCQVSSDLLREDSEGSLSCVMSAHRKTFCFLFHQEKVLDQDKIKKFLFWKN